MQVYSGSSDEAAPGTRTGVIELMDDSLDRQMGFNAVSDEEQKILIKTTAFIAN
jgi:hypothetical protein